MFRRDDEKYISKYKIFLTANFIFPLRLILLLIAFSLGIIGYYFVSMMK